MRRLLGTLLFAGALVFSSVGFSACSGHARVYDVEYRDYHPWDHNEIVYYQRWEVETHRSHVEYDRRNEQEQREYWRWRHSQH
jgi:hypothetical protein